MQQEYLPRVTAVTDQNSMSVHNIIIACMYLVDQKQTRKRNK